MALVETFGAKIAKFGRFREKLKRPARKGY